MNTLEITYATPTARVSIVIDEDCTNPLEDWDHGVQFIEITRSREYHSLEKYSNTHGAGKPIDPGTLTEYREFYDEADYWHDTPRQQSPSLRTFLNHECANWGTVHRSGYDGTLTFTPSASVDDTDLDGSEAIACISRSMWREMQMIPEGKPMPKGYRERAADMLKGIINEYNKWATGECYGVVTETHNSACPYCEDKEDPAQDCPCWDEEDSTFYGLIGYEHAQQEQAAAVRTLQYEAAPAHA